jgi:hypothetical protein
VSNDYLGGGVGCFDNDALTVVRALVTTETEMTFEEFVAEWRKQVREYGGGVPQEAVDMAEQAWEIAAAEEREACARVCEETMADTIMGGNKDYATGREMGVVVCANKIRMRSNAEVSGRPLADGPA